MTKNALTSKAIKTKKKSKGIVSWPKTERPREKLLHSGPETLSDGELVAVLLRIGKSGQSAEDLGRHLLAKFKGISGIDRAHIEELMTVPGIGIAKTAQLKAAIEIGKRVRMQNAQPRSFDHAADVAAYIRPRFEGKRQESFLTILLDGQNRLISERMIAEGIPTQATVYVRQFVEDRAYLKAVVSLPQETFISSGASVKASLLFLQKYTDEEKEQFDQTYATANAEIKTKYADEIEKETQRLENTIAKAKENKDAESRKALQKELKDYLKQMEDKKAAESRELLKERFDYPIFMYETEKVGISATGDEDQNELYPNANQPEGIEKTCLKWYQEFLLNPNELFNTGSNA